MSDYFDAGTAEDDMPLFRSRIDKPDIDQIDWNRLESDLIRRWLTPHGSPVRIEFLRKEFNSRVETITHRLRKQGHVIDTVSGCYIYRHGPPADWEKAPKDARQLYFASSHWKTVRGQRLIYDGHCCALCRKRGEDAKLHVHHWRYNLFNEDIRNDLQTLCSDCHASIHQLIKGSSVSFPSYLPAEQILRIKEEAECKL